MNDIFTLIAYKAMAFGLFHSLYGPMPEIRTVTALIDTGLNLTQENMGYLCRVPHFDLTGTNLGDHNGHGTLMFNLITHNIDATKNCILLIKWCDTCKTKGESNLTVVRASEIVRELNPAFVNMSYAGSLISNDEKINIQDSLNQGTKFSVASGNDAKDLDKRCDLYPACYFKHPNFHVLGSLMIYGNRTNYSNYGKVVTDWEIVENPRGGTSSATAIHTNKLMRGIAQ